MGWKLKSSDKSFFLKRIPCTHLISYNDTPNMAQISLQDGVTLYTKKTKLKKVLSLVVDRLMHSKDEELLKYDLLLAIHHNELMALTVIKDRDNVKYS